MPKKQNIRKKESILVALSAVILSGIHPEQVRAQSISCPQPMNFGGAIQCGTASTILLRPNNTRVVGGCLVPSAAPFARGRCNVTQTFPLRPVIISVTATSYKMSASTGKTMTVNAFNLLTNAGGPTVTTTAFFVSVPVGATLNVGANQTAGTYTGTVTINAVKQ